MCSEITGNILQAKLWDYVLPLARKQKKNALDIIIISRDQETIIFHQVSFFIYLRRDALSFYLFTNYVNEFDLRQAHKLFVSACLQYVLLDDPFRSYTINSS